MSGVTLVDDGTAAATVRHWSGDGAPVAAFAADELASYLGEMTGADLPVATADASFAPEHAAGAVVAGGDAAAALAAADDALADQPADAFAIETTGDALACAGTTHRGILYGVYAFLESQGVRFFAPDYEFYEGHHEHVPAAGTVTADAGAVEAPDWAYRSKLLGGGVSHDADSLAALVDWMAKARLNIFFCRTEVRTPGGLLLNGWDMWREDLRPELEKRGLRVATGGHGFDTFLSPEDHPEWYDGEHNVFDVADDDAVGAYVEGVLDYLRERPEIDIFWAWPPDGAEWPPEAVESYGSPVNAYARVVNRLAAAVDAELDRAVEIEAIAYYSNLWPPDTEYMYDDDVVVDLAAYDRSYADPIDAPGENEYYADAFRAWRAAFDGPLRAHEYYRKYSWHSLPVVLPELLAADLAAYRELGVDGILSYPEAADWLTYELTHLLEAAMAWDTDLDVAAYTGRYREERYGRAADAMAEYFDCVERAGRALFDGAQGRYDDKDALSTALDAYRGARAAIEDGLDLPVGYFTEPEGERVEFLLERLSINAEYAVADTTANLHEVRGEDDAAARERLRAGRLVLENRFSGVLAANHYSLGNHTFQWELPFPTTNYLCAQLYRNERRGGEGTDRPD
ncbi:MAG: DUF4838 domain-containing protein [Halobacteriaceae archaeon]